MEHELQASLSKPMIIETGVGRKNTGRIEFLRE